MRAKYNNRLLAFAIYDVHGFAVAKQRPSSKPSTATANNPAPPVLTASWLEKANIKQNNVSANEACGQATTGSTQERCVVPVFQFAAMSVVSTSAQPDIAMRMIHGAPPRMGCCQACWHRIGCELYPHTPTPPASGVADLHCGRRMGAQHQVLNVKPGF